MARTVVRCLIRAGCAFVLLSWAAVGQQPAGSVWRSLLPPGVHLLPAREARSTYSLLVSVPAPSQLAEPAPIRVLTGDTVVVSKTLHIGDPDLYTFIHGGSATRLETSVPVAVQVNDLGVAANIEAEPNNTWQTANPYALGQTLWASGDEAPYIPVSLPTRIEPNPHEDWFRFDFAGAKPKLVHFSLELVDRD